jgi:hypothetical protein
MPLWDAQGTQRSHAARKIPKNSDQRFFPHISSVMQKNAASPTG